ncbi:WD40 repeat domain-containing protein [Nocardioides ferulae]|uniref:WD40 repeat domain-containing protein n=1 Tax=Nocardioides ferulae TaxID=2340821 RepID=UPI000EB10720|nr:WD40 repeat domain-containing protein [Nocardioides ferulae]
MRGRALDRVLGWAAVAPLLLGAAAAPAAGDGEVVFRLQDPAIVEASGLAVVDGLFVTHNDSGDGGRLFTVDPATGETVGVTSWADEPDDLEAIAPAGDGHVWAGDIGDNLAGRDSISVLRVPVGRGDRAPDPTAYQLTYPDGARDAETLLAHPVTGRLLVVSKVIFGGVLYAAPRRLDAAAPNPMRAVGRVVGFATDGAFFPDGRHLVLRDYGSATVYSWPDLEEVGSFALPDQQQGEGIAVDDAGRVFAGTEGLHAPVHRVRLPRGVAEAVAPVDTATGEEDTATPSDPATAPDAASDRPTPVWAWAVAGGLGGIAVIAGAAMAVRRRR